MRGACLRGQPGGGPGLRRSRRGPSSPRTSWVPGPLGPPALDGVLARRVLTPPSAGVRSATTPLGHRARGASRPGGSPDAGRWCTDGGPVALPAPVDATRCEPARHRERSGGSGPPVSPRRRPAPLLSRTTRASSTGERVPRSGVGEAVREAGRCGGTSRRRTPTGAAPLWLRATRTARPSSGPGSRRTRPRCAVRSTSPVRLDPGEAETSCRAPRIPYGCGIRIASTGPAGESVQPPRLRVHGVHQERGAHQRGDRTSARRRRPRTFASGQRTTRSRGTRRRFRRIRRCGGQDAAASAASERSQRAGRPWRIALHRAAAQQVGTRSCRTRSRMGPSPRARSSTSAYGLMAVPTHAEAAACRAEREVPRSVRRGRERLPGGGASRPRPGRGWRCAAVCRRPGSRAGGRVRRARRTAGWRVSAGNGKCPGGSPGRCAARSVDGRPRRRRCRGDAPGARSARSGRRGMSQRIRSVGSQDRVSGPVGGRRAISRAAVSVSSSASRTVAASRRAAGVGTTRAAPPRGWRSTPRGPPRARALPADGAVRHVEFAGGGVSCCRAAPPPLEGLPGAPSEQVGAGHG